MNQKTELEKAREDLDTAIKKADKWEMEHRRIKGFPHNPILALMAQTQDYRTAAEAEIERLKGERGKLWDALHDEGFKPEEVINEN